MPNRQTRSVCPITTLLAVALFAAHASAQVGRVGVDSLEFSWEEAPGSPPFYAVSISYDKLNYVPFGLVADNRVVVAVTPGDSVSIIVSGVRPHAVLNYEVGPASAPSEEVHVLAAPQFAGTGSWLLACASCEGVQFRDVSDPSVQTPQSGLGPPWWLVGLADRLDGSRWLVWHRWDTHQVLATNADDSSLQLGPFDAPESTHVDLIDMGGNGDDEVLFVDRFNENRLHFYKFDATNSFHFIGSTPGKPGGVLGPVADYSGDWREDLLWIETAAGEVEVWSLTDYEPSYDRWRSPPQEGFSLDLSPSPGYVAADADDYDGDGFIDLLWRGPTGDLWITYLEEDQTKSIEVLPGRPGDDQRAVVGSVDVDGVPGAEIALREWLTGRIWIAYPAIRDYPLRSIVLDPGADWFVIDVD